MWAVSAQVIHGTPMANNNDCSLSLTVEDRGSLRSPRKNDGSLTLTTENGASGEDNAPNGGEAEVIVISSAGEDDEKDGEHATVKAGASVAADPPLTIAKRAREGVGEGEKNIARKKPRRINGQPSVNGGSDIHPARGSGPATTANPTEPSSTIPPPDDHLNETQASGTSVKKRRLIPRSDIHLRKSCLDESLLSNRSGLLPGAKLLTIGLPNYMGESRSRLSAPFPPRPTASTQEARRSSDIPSSFPPLEDISLDSDSEDEDVLPNLKAIIASSINKARRAETASSSPTLPPAKPPSLPRRPRTGPHALSQARQTSQVPRPSKVSQQPVASASTAPPPSRANPTTPTKRSSLGKITPTTTRTSQKLIDEYFSPPGNAIGGVSSQINSSQRRSSSFPGSGRRLKGYKHSIEYLDMCEDNGNNDADNARTSATIPMPPVPKFHLAESFPIRRRFVGITEHNKRTRALRSDKLYDVCASQFVSPVTTVGGTHTPTVIAVAGCGKLSVWSSSAKMGDGKLLRLIGWDLSENTPLSDIPLKELWEGRDPPDVLCCEFLFDRTTNTTYLAAGGWSGFLIVACVSDGTYRHVAGPGADVHHIHVHPTNPIFFAVASDDYTTRIYNGKTGHLVAIFLCATEYQRSGVLSVAWSPDGKRLVTGESDGTVRLWDADTEAIRNAMEYSFTGQPASIELETEERIPPVAREYVPLVSTPWVFHDHIDWLKFWVDGRTVFAKSVQGCVKAFQFELDHLPPREPTVIPAPPPSAADAELSPIPPPQPKHSIPPYIYAHFSAELLYLFLLPYETPGDHMLWFVRADISPSGRYLAVGNHKGEVFIWDVVKVMDHYANAYNGGLASLSKSKKKKRKSVTSMIHTTNGDGGGGSNEQPTFEDLWLDENVQEWAAPSLKFRVQTAAAASCKAQIRSLCFVGDEELVGVSDDARVWRWCVRNT